MEPLLNRVAKKYPDLGRDAALARIGRENFVKYASEQPFDYAWMVIRKIQNMWDRGSSAAMSPKFWFAYHKVLVFWALAALVGLALAAPLGGAADRPHDPRDHARRRAAARRAAARAAADAVRARARRRDDRVARRGGPRLATGYPAARPMELSALRILGLGLAACLIAFAVWRRRTLRNGDILLLFAAALALALVSATDVLDAVLSFFSFERGGGGRILGLAVFAIVVLFAADAARPAPERPHRAQAVGDARGHRLGGVPRRRPARALQGQGRGRHPRLQRGGQHRLGPPAHPRDRVRRRDGGARGRRRLARPHGRRRPRARRRGRPPRHQPRRRRGAAHRLPADERLGRARRRHARRGRPAPARGDVAARAARARRRGRRRPRLARARPRRGQPLRPRDGDHLLQPARVLHHPHEGHRLLQRLPRRARERAARRSSCARSSSTPPSS